VHPCALGERLREERDRLGLNQEELGQIGGVNRNTQGKYEKGERSPDSDYMAAAAAAGVDVLYVLTGARATAAAEGLSADEAKVLEQYRSLPDQDKASVARLTTALAEMAGRYDVKK